MSGHEGTPRIDYETEREHDYDAAVSAVAGPEPDEGLRALSDAAAPGEWAYYGVDSVAGGMIYDSTRCIAGVYYEQPEDHDGRIVRHLLTPEADANGALIVAAVNHVRAVLAAPAAAPVGDEGPPRHGDLAWYEDSVQGGYPYRVTVVYRHRIGWCNVAGTLRPIDVEGRGLTLHTFWREGQPYPPPGDEGAARAAVARVLALCDEADRHKGLHKFGAVDTDVIRAALSAVSGEHREPGDDRG